MSGAERWLASQAGGRSSRASQDSMVYNVGMDRGNDENRSPPSAARRPSRRSTSGGHTVAWRRHFLPYIYKLFVKPETQSNDVMHHESSPGFHFRFVVNIHIGAPARTINTALRIALVMTLCNPTTHRNTDRSRSRDAGVLPGAVQHSLPQRQRAPVRGVQRPALAGARLREALRCAGDPGGRSPDRRQIRWVFAALRRRRDRHSGPLP